MKKLFLYLVILTALISACNNSRRVNLSPGHTHHKKMKKPKFRQSPQDTLVLFTNYLLFDQKGKRAVPKAALMAMFFYNSHPEELIDQSTGHSGLVENGAMTFEDSTNTTWLKIPRRTIGSPLVIVEGQYGLEKVLVSFNGSDEDHSSWFIRRENNAFQIVEPGQSHWDKRKGWIFDENPRLGKSWLMVKWDQKDLISTKDVIAPGNQKAGKDRVRF